MMNYWQVIMPWLTGQSRGAEHHGKGMVHGFEGNRCGRLTIGSPLHL